MIPCKNCITLGICKAQLKPGNTYSNFIDIIVPKCSIVRDYALPGWNTQEFVYLPPLIDRVIYFLKHNKDDTNDTM